MDIVTKLKEFDVSHNKSNFLGGAIEWHITKTNILYFFLPPGIIQIISTFLLSNADIFEFCTPDQWRLHGKCTGSAP